MKYFSFCLFFLQSIFQNIHSQNLQYTKTDSLEIVSLLRDAKKLSDKTNRVLYFAQHFIGRPYVGGTLEVNHSEQLIINLQQLDCTTFVENILALSLCDNYNKREFYDFCHYLQTIRYKNGNISYPARLHYFTQWIDEGEKNGYVTEVKEPNPPFTSIETLEINYMSINSSLYPMLVKDRTLIPQIRKVEKEITGRKCRYIPKSEIRNNDLYRHVIKDGDIIAITTQRKGLDTSHIGIAVWKENGLHMLHASRIYKRIIEDNNTLHKYMQKQRMQKGIRIIRIN